MHPLTARTWTPPPPHLEARWAGWFTWRMPADFIGPGGPGRARQRRGEPAAGGGAQAPGPGRSPAMAIPVLLVEPVVAKKSTTVPVTDALAKPSPWPACAEAAKLGNRLSVEIRRPAPNRRLLVKRAFSIGGRRDPRLAAAMETRRFLSFPMRSHENAAICVVMPSIRPFSSGAG